MEIKIEIKLSDEIVSNKTIEELVQEALIALELWDHQLRKFEVSNRIIQELFYEKNKK